MALIQCSECGREISDKAEACLGCGAPVAVNVKQEASQQSRGPATVSYHKDTDTFTGTMVLLAKLAMRAVQELGWKLDQVNETLGLITFQTSISWGSWSGVSCSLNIEEISPNTFRVTGTGKQNVQGGGLFSVNIGGEARSKAHKAIEKMKDLVLLDQPRSEADNGNGISENPDGSFTYRDRTFQQQSSAVEYKSLRERLGNAR